MGPGQDQEIAARLREGALAIYPTDTLYALGCCGLDGETVRKLREAKGREAQKPLSLIAADIVQARSLASQWPAAADRLALAFWPGPLTLVVPAASTLPGPLLAGAATVAVRVPASDVARALAKAAGPLVATSANRAGEAPCVTVDQALRAFPDAGLALDVGPLDGLPSTIVDLAGPDSVARILREGRIGIELIERVLGASGR